MYYKTENIFIRAKAIGRRFLDRTGIDINSVYMRFQFSLENEDKHCRGIIEWFIFNSGLFSPRGLIVCIIQTNFVLLLWFNFLKNAEYVIRLLYQSIIISVIEFCFKYTLGNWVGQEYFSYSSMPLWRYCEKIFNFVVFHIPIVHQFSREIKLEEYSTETIGIYRPVSILMVFFSEIGPKESY